MSDKPKDSGLYSMQDVNLNNKGGASANVRPVKSKGWASDEDAGALLAGILDDTESTAKEEERKRQRELEAKERQRKEQEAAEEARKRAEAERLLREEEARAAQAKNRRTGLLEAIHGPSPEELERRRREQEEQRKEEEMQRKLAEAERARVAAEQRAAQQAREAQIKEQQRLEALANQAQAAPVAKKSNIGLVIGAVAVVIALLGGGVAAFFIMNQEDPTANLAYAKTTLDAQGFVTASVEKDFQPIYTAPPEVAADDSGSKAKAGGRAKRRTTGGPAANKGKGNNTANKGKGGRNFGDLGGGGIVF